MATGAAQGWLPVLCCLLACLLCLVRPGSKPLCSTPAVCPSSPCVPPGSPAPSSSSFSFYDTRQRTRIGWARGATLRSCCWCYSCCAAAATPRDPTKNCYLGLPLRGCSPVLSSSRIQPCFLLCFIDLPCVAGSSLLPPSALPSRVVFHIHIIEADRPLLVAGSADGAVRAWRSYLNAVEQRLAAALQVGACVLTSRA